VHLVAGQRPEERPVVGEGVEQLDAHRSTSRG
jgi:hypothetical protein